MLSCDILWLLYIRIFATWTEFDNFLFAPIGEESNGMLLSVLSALAPLDIDPWQEAAKLSGLLEGAATRRLASLIAALPDEARPSPDALVARTYVGMPLFGETETLQRVLQLSSIGRC
jgi:hypothetical protein